MADDFSQEHTYLKQHHLTVYFEDCIRGLLEARRRSSSFTPVKLDINTHLRDYFAQVKRELHVVGREYTFVNSTPYNRCALIAHIWSKYETTIPTPGTLKELHTLILTICPDFPYSLLELSASLLADRDWSLSVDYIAFLRALQLTFIYSEFIYESQQLFRLLTHHLTCHVPTAETSVPQENHDQRQLLSEGFQKLIATRTCSCPPKHILDEVLILLEQQKPVSHQKFLVQLAKSVDLSRFIGKEPIIIKPARLNQSQRPTIEPVFTAQNEPKLTLTSIPSSTTHLLPPLPKQQGLVRERPIRHGSAASGIISSNASRRADSATSFITSSNSAKASHPTTNTAKQERNDTDTDVESVSSDTDT
ncbi:unnamed protein product [Adineta ricciae]|uniref:Centriolar satellite-associated tubulin polyglutamylase complex regulator 1 n=1 Tax=Adineta ricciae TaxID=249248 RepID=A0A815A348_ADIRI|nr:unnamed protein product [Adineta ricciae]CAF1250521.1 unnamed protein product [Adineta ricciae]